MQYSEDQIYFSNVEIGEISVLYQPVDILFSMDSINFSKSDIAFLSFIRDWPLTTLKYLEHIFFWFVEKSVE